MTTRAEKISRLEHRILDEERQVPAPGMTVIYEFRPYELAEEFGLTHEEVCVCLDRVFSRL